MVINTSLVLQELLGNAPPTFPFEATPLLSHIGSSKDVDDGVLGYGYESQGSYDADKALVQALDGKPSAHGHKAFCNQSGLLSFLRTGHTPLWAWAKGLPPENEHSEFLRSDHMPFWTLGIRSSKDDDDGVLGYGYGS
ncbi:hypothetical protein Tco_1143310 [Tanacetum coccineum]